MLRSWILVAVAALALSACGEKAGLELARKACAHTAELGVHEGFVKSHKGQLDDKTAAAEKQVLAAFLSSHADQLERCAKSGEDSPKKKVECTLAAKTVAEAVQCAK